MLQTPADPKTIARPLSAVTPILAKVRAKVMTNEWLAVVIAVVKKSIEYAGSGLWRPPIRSDVIDDPFAVVQEERLVYIASRVV